MRAITTRSRIPTDIFKMVENSIKESEDYPTESELWQSLPRKIRRQTLKHILHHLKLDGKIMYGKEHRIIWIQADDLQSKILQEEFEVLS